MIAPAKISPPPPLQGRPPSHGQGMAPIHGPPSEAVRRGAGARPPPRLGGASRPAGGQRTRGRTKGGRERKERERAREKRRKFRDHRRRCVELALPFREPSAVLPKFEFPQKRICFKPLPYSPPRHLCYGDANGPRFIAHCRNALRSRS